MPEGTGQLARTQASVTGGGSVLSRYQNVVVGSSSLLSTAYYEWCSYLAVMPGAAGMLFRKLFWPRLLGSCGTGVFFGHGVTMRHPRRIFLGRRVVISESCILDARSPEQDRVIVVEDDAMLSNAVMLSCKEGSITVGARTGIGAQAIVQSTRDEPVKIGADVIIGPRCYITGGGNYNTDRLDIPMRRQGKRTMGGSTIEDDVWLGANVTVVGGVTIGTGSIVAAGAVVTKDIPPRSICMGVPAKVARTRD